MKKLWTKDKEINFFKESSKFAAPEKLFYISDDSRYYAYWPKDYKGKTSTLQSRNSLIGNYTEKFSVDLLKNYAKANKIFAMQGAICNEIGLTSQSPADIALSTKKGNDLQAKDIIAIFEVKMSIVWNWELKNKRLICLGDFKTHKGRPGLLRSDSILKAIGKCINIRVSDFMASHIPLIVLGNTPISQNYINKVDHLIKAGVIQGFWSLNPDPLDKNPNTLKQTPEKGFVRIDSYNELKKMLDVLLNDQQEFFSSMRTKKELGKLIQIADKEKTVEGKAEKFLKLIRA